MLVAGIAVGLAGLALAANAGGIADGMARVNRGFPWWMKSPFADYPAAMRIAGGAFVVFGAAFIWLAVRGPG